MCVYLWLQSPAHAQEVVADLATGRVYVYVSRDAIVVGALGVPAEPASNPPVFVDLPGRRIAILLGAAEWLRPGEAQPLLRLAAEIPRLAGEIGGPKRLEAEAASDLESIGMAVLEPLRGVVSQIHRKLDIAPDEPLLELLLIGYTADYGPEVWSLRYRITQDFLRDGFWRTRLLRPMYIQHYPPERHEPRTLVELRYPDTSGEPTLLELLQRGDSRLAALRPNEAAARALARLERGESHRAQRGDAVEFLRAALRAIALPGQTPVLALIAEDRGLQWILAPPEPLQRAEEADDKREPGAPTLRRPRPPQ